MVTHGKTITHHLRKGILGDEFQFVLVCMLTVSSSSLSMVHEKVQLGKLDDFNYPFIIYIYKRSSKMVCEIYELIWSLMGYDQNGRFTPWAIAPPPNKLSVTLI